MTFRFGDFTLDTRTGTLDGPDGPVALRRQTFRLLRVLLEHAPGLVDRDTLLDEAWGRTALSPNVLPQAVSELRQALGDSAQAPRYIATMHRRGYRILCPVDRMEGETARPASPGRPPPAGRFRRGISGYRLTALGLAFAGMAAALAYGWQRDAQWRWLHGEVLPEIRELIEIDVASAYRLAREARRRAPDDRELEQLWRDITLPVPITSEPPGARVAVRGYRETDREWIELGRTPLEDVRLPLTQLRFRLELEGHAPLEAAPGVLPQPDPFHLHAPGEIPDGMVFVPPGPVRYLGIDANLPGFWIDRHEVTNRQYKRFVDDGGYDRAEFWPEALEVDGRTLSRDGLLEQLVDTTGMPGPATWALGTYPEDRADHPVEGVSWYEAAAYAAYAGKDLPTVFHWSRAAGLGTPQVPVFSEILDVSNFGGDGTVAAGSMRGLGPYGTSDMPGNVAEWCANPAGRLRHILGGSWMDDGYVFRDPNAQNPLLRRPGYGFRLIRREEPVNEAHLAAVSFPDRELPAPVDDTSFQRYAGLYDYDSTPLDVSIEEVDDSHQAWRRERVSYAAAYPGERITTQIFLPRKTPGPYQAVVHFPGGDSLMLDSSRDAGLMAVEPFLRSGRAVVYPVYQGTFERRVPGPLGPIAERDLIIQQIKDVRRTLDYLETRDDIDMDRVALHALSYGGWRAPFALAVENRFAMAMIQSAGINPRELLPEIQQQHYLPRVSIPVLLITGKDDFAFPYDSSQRPFFELLGTPPRDKRHLALDWGHLPPGYSEVARALLEWSDRWLGPVNAG